MQLKNLSDEVALPLPDDLLWTDEHAWTPTVASTSYLITGALLIQSATRQAGRPITLVGAADMAWVTRDGRATACMGVHPGRHDCRALRADLGRRTVLHGGLPPRRDADRVGARAGIPARADTDFYRLTLKFLEL
jgi:hypothetical protein